MMFTGNTIDELMGMVQKAEAQAESLQIEQDLIAYSAPAFNVYGYEQFQRFERDLARMGAA